MSVRIVYLSLCLIYLLCVCARGIDAIRSPRSSLIAHSWHISVPASHDDDNDDASVSVGSQLLLLLAEARRLLGSAHGTMEGKREEEPP